MPIEGKSAAKCMNEHGHSKEGRKQVEVVQASTDKMAKSR